MFLSEISQLLPSISAGRAGERARPAKDRRRPGARVGGKLPISDRDLREVLRLAAQGRPVPALIVEAIARRIEAQDE